MKNPSEAFNYILLQISTFADLKKMKPDVSAEGIPSGNSEVGKNHLTN